MKLHAVASVCATLLACWPTIATANGWCTSITKIDNQFVCREPPLSDLETRLDTIYQDRRKLLSDEGGSLLAASEQEWHEFVAQDCDDLKSDETLTGPAICRAEAYKKRIADLSDIRRLGPFTFNRIDSYATAPSGQKQEDERLGPLTRHLAYPQIDRPASPQETAWNRQVALFPDAEGATFEGALNPFNPHNWPTKSLGLDVDIDIDYALHFASNRMISLQWNFTYDGHPGAHSNTRVAAQNILLTPDLRTLAAGDVFRPDRNWRGKLKRLFRAALLKKGWDPIFEHQMTDVLDYATTPDRWTFTQEGLSFALSDYEGGCYACMPPFIVIRWSVLKPLLSPHSVAP